MALIVALLIALSSNPVPGTVSVADHDTLAPEVFERCADAQVVRFETRTGEHLAIVCGDLSSVYVWSQ